MSTTERMPPQETVAEIGLVAAWINSESPPLIRKTRVDPADFYRPDTEKVAAAILGLVDDGLPVTSITVWQRVKADGHENHVGWAWFAELAATAGGTNPDLAYEYMKPVKRAATSRRLICAAESLMQTAYETTDEGELRDRVASVTCAMSDVTPTELQGHIGEFTGIALKELAEERKENDPRTLSWGLRDLDRAGMFIRPGDFPVVAARPGCGKSTFSRQWAVRTAATTGRKVIFVSFEEPAEDLVRDAILAEASVRDPHYRGLAPEDREKAENAAQWLSKIPVYFPTRFPTKLAAFCGWLETTIATHNPAAVVVDYIGLLANRAPGTNACEKMTNTSGRLRTVARETQCPILAVSQLNRASAGEKREPELHDLRDSGSVEQDATAVLMLHYPYGMASREQRAAKGSMLVEGELELLVKKARKARGFVRVLLTLDGPYRRMLAREAT